MKSNVLWVCTTTSSTKSTVRSAGTFHDVTETRPSVHCFWKHRLARLLVESNLMKAVSLLRTLCSRLYMWWNTNRTLSAYLVFRFAHRVSAYCLFECRINWNVQWVWADSKSPSSNTSPTSYFLSFLGTYYGWILGRKNWPCICQWRISSLPLFLSCLKKAIPQDIWLEQ